MSSKEKLEEATDDVIGKIDGKITYSDLKKARKKLIEFREKYKQLQESRKDCYLAKEVANEAFEKAWKEENDYQNFLQKQQQEYKYFLEEWSNQEDN